MALTLAELLVKLGVDVSGVIAGLDDLGASVAQAAKDAEQKWDGFKRLGGQLESVGMQLSAGITAPILAIGGAATKMAADFDLGMHKVASLLDNVSQGEFKRLSDQTIALSRSLGVDAVQAADALYQAISSGVPKENAVEFLAVASKAAIAGVTDTRVAVDGLTTVIQAFGLKTSDAAAVADAMFMAVNKGKLEFPELAQSIGLAAGTAAALKVSYQELLAAGATLTNTTGQKIPEAMTMLQSAMKAMIEPTAQMTDLIKKTGYESGAALINAKGLEGAIQAVSAAAGGSITVLAGAYGRVEGLRGALGLTGQNAARAAEDLKSMSSSAGAAGKAFAEIDKSTSRQFQRLLTEVKDTAIELGTALLPAVNSLLQAFKPLAATLEEIVQWFAHLPAPMQTAIEAFALMLAAIGPLALGLGAAINAVASMATAISTIAPVASAFTGAIANVVQAVRLDMVGALTAGETAILRMGQAVSIAAAAFVGWKLGEWAYEQIPGVKALGDAMADLILSIPGVEAAWLRLTGATKASETAFEGQRANIERLTKYLKEHGVVVQRGGESQDEYAKKLLKAAQQLDAQGKSSKTAAAETKNLADQQKKHADVIGKATKSQVDFGKATSDVGTRLKALLDIEKDDLKARDEAVKKLELHKYGLDEATKAEKAFIAAWKLDGAIKDLEDLNRRLEETGELNQDIRKVAVPTFATEIPRALREAARPLEGLDAAFKRLGIQTVDELDRVAEQAQKDYELIAQSGKASADGVLKAELAALKASIEARKAHGEEVTADEQAKLDRIEEQLKGHSERVRVVWDDISRVVSEAFDNMARGMADAIVHWSGLWDTFKNVAQQFAAGILEIFLQQLLAPLKESLTKWLTSEDGLGGFLQGLGKAIEDGLKAIGSKIGGWLSGLFSGGSAAGEAAGGIASAAGGAGSAAGGAAGSGIGAAAGGAMGAVGVVAGVVSAVSGVISNFQLAKQETSLNAIEHNTRYTMMYVGERSDGGILGVLFRTLEEISWGVQTKATEASRDRLIAIAETAPRMVEWLGNIFLRLGEFQNDFRAWAGAGGAALAGTGGASISVTVYVQGGAVSDYDRVGQGIVDGIRRASGGRI